MAKPKNELVDWDKFRRHVYKKSFTHMCIYIERDEMIYICIYM